jgi:beta-lactamase superfamily II metal-dependent hydrolase
MLRPSRFPRLLAFAGAVAFASVSAASTGRPLELYWIDSEGGGSTLIVTPAGESVLIDAGNPGTRDPSRIIAAAKTAGLSRIDYLLITHWHPDHFGGAAGLAAEFPLGKIYQRVLPDTDPEGNGDATWPLRSQAYRAIAVPRETLVPGLPIPLKSAAGSPPLTLRCLAVERHFVAPTAAQRARATASAAAPAGSAESVSENANSAVFLLAFGDFRFFDGADLNATQEPKLVSPCDLVGIVDVYQTDHHGADDSSHPLFLRSLAPTVVVMNNGPRKGGPADLLPAFRALPSLQALYQVHKGLNVPAAANTDDAYIANVAEVQPAENCPANLIRLAVAADTKSYTLSIPASGHSHTYRTTPK